MTFAKSRKFGATTLALFMGLTPSWANDWVALDENGIVEALSGRKLQYENAWQDFRASGATLYNAGQDSWGTWTTRGAQYCSQWPPSARWACFDVALSEDGTKVRFEGTGNDISIGVYTD